MDSANNAIPDHTMRPLVDGLLLEQGRLDPFELLLAAELLGYEDYVAWRTGGRPDLQGALRAEPEAVAGFLEDAGVYARGQKLVAVELAHTAWGDRERPLSVGSHPGLTRACALVYAPPPDRCQLDLFQDSTGLLLEEEVQTALVEHRTDRARDRVARLMHREPRHPRLGGFLRLIQTLDDADATAPEGCAEDRWRELEEVGPLAEQLLGHRARDFLRTLWADLAERLGERLAERPFDLGSGEFHASIAWTRAGRWERARTAIESEPDWRDHPALVLIHAEAAWHGRDHVGARRDWLSLCWEFPLDAERTFCSAHFPDVHLADLWNAYGDLDEPLETEDFPAWLLIRDTRVFSFVSPDSAPNDDRGEAFRLLHQILTDEDSIERRRALAEMHPRLLWVFLAGKQAKC